MISGCGTGQTLLMAFKAADYTLGWQRLLLLLLGTLLCAVVANQDSAPVPADKCSNGMTVGKAFSDCLWGLAFGSPDMSRVFFGASTVRDIETFLPTYCGTVLPDARSCFSERIANCESGQQQQLTELADDAGYFCLPGSALPHPAVSSVLESFSEADLDATQECADTEEDSNQWMDCDDEARQTAMGHLDRDAMMALPVQDWTSIMKKYYKVLMQCTVRETAQSSSSCSQWRGVAFKRLTLVLQPWAALGIPLPLTQQELNDPFQ